MASNTGLITDKARELRQLVKGADSIELKLTPAVSTRDRSACGRPRCSIQLDAQIRQVFFFDEPDVLGRPRSQQGRCRQPERGGCRVRGDDSVVKLRPVVPAELPAPLRKLPEFVVEVDALPGGYVCSASLKGVPKSSVRDTVAGKGR